MLELRGYGEDDKERDGRKFGDENHWLLWMMVCGNGGDSGWTDSTQIAMV